MSAHGRTSRLVPNWSQGPPPSPTTASSRNLTVLQGRSRKRLEAPDGQGTVRPSVPADAGGSWSPTHELRIVIFPAACRPERVLPDPPLRASRPTPHGRPRPRGRPAPHPPQRRLRQPPRPYARSTSTSGSPPNRPGGRRVTRIGNRFGVGGCEPAAGLLGRRATRLTGRPADRRPCRAVVTVVAWTSTAV
jgi:hypothetical protein